MQHESDAKTLMELGVPLDKLLILHRKGDVVGEVTTRRATEGMPAAIPPSDDDFDITPSPAPNPNQTP